ncbi:MAG: acyl-ACP desaturase [Frankiaceae bacterium]
MRPLTGPLTDAELLRELEPATASALARHLAVAPEWFPHELVPWSRGRDFDGAAGEPWAPEQSAVAPPVRAALELNLLTEDNLPSYHLALMTSFAGDGAWGEWIRRWTAEEGRHAAAIRDYLLVSRAVDPVALERDRMVAVSRGWTATTAGPLDALAYGALQELATRVAHRNTGRLSGDPVAERLLARVAADENLHMVLYRDVMAAALELAPEQAVPAIERELRAFRMPGAAVPGFARRSVQIADAGVYDVRIHRAEVVAPLLRHWRALSLPLRTADAQLAQAGIAGHLDELELMAARYERRRDARLATAPEAPSPGA